MAVEPAYGEMDAQGAVVVDALTCAVTGLPIQAGDALVTILGSRYFYRVKGGVLRLMTDEDKATLASGAPGGTPIAAPKALTSKDGK